MKQLLTIAFILVFPVIACAQGSDTLSRQSVDIINQSVKDKRYRVLLVRETGDYAISEMTEALGKGVFIKQIQGDRGEDLSERLVLSKKELKKLKKDILKMRSFIWQESDAKKLNFDGIKTISSDSSLLPELDIAIKYRIVPPVFTRKGEYCFLYFHNACGPLCGATRFWILKKTGDKWKIWHILIMSNS